MERLNPDKLYVTFLTGTIVDNLVLPRRYTLTHSDRTGELSLSIGTEYNKKQISGLYTRFMRDEVLAELTGREESPEFYVYCHVSGGLVLGTARWRFDIFQSELRLVLEAFRHGDKILFEKIPALDDVNITVRFKSTRSTYDKTENWGIFSDYR
jgi:hypothetical protein